MPSLDDILSERGALNLGNGNLEDIAGKRLENVVFTVLRMIFNKNLT